MKIRLIGILIFLLLMISVVIPVIGTFNDVNDIDEGAEKVPAHVKQYRVGLHKPGEKIKLKIIKRK